MAIVRDEEDGNLYDDEAEIFSPRVVSTKPRGFQSRRPQVARLTKAMSLWQPLPADPEGVDP